MGMLGGRPLIGARQRKRMGRGGKNRRQGDGHQAQALATRLAARAVRLGISWRRLLPLIGCGNGGFGCMVAAARKDETAMGGRIISVNGSKRKLRTELPGHRPGRHRHEAQHQHPKAQKPPERLIHVREGRLTIRKRSKPENLTGFRNVLGLAGNYAGSLLCWR